MLAGLGEREELLAAAWLASLRAPRTRRAYASDIRGWLGWLAERGTDVLDAGRVHVDMWAAGQQDQGAEAVSVRRRLSALSSFYRYCAAHDLAAPRGAALYRPRSGQRLEEFSLDLMADLDLKGEGDNSMPGNRQPGPGVWGGVPGDPRDMAKAGLPEAQSPEGANAHPPERRL